MPRPPRWTISLALLLGACASKRAAEPMTMYESDEDSSAYGLGFAGGGDGGGGYAEAPAAMPAAPVSVSAPARGRAEMSRKSARAPVAYDVSAAPPPPPPPPGDGGVQSGDDSPAEHAEQRMVHYDGYARMRVGKLEEAADTLVKLATDAGGRVESLSRTRLVLRVPVAGFRETFARMLGVGDVLDKSITAQDVTEAFQSVELRLQSARAARERLQALLAKAKDEREKLMLIRELQRLGEEIDQLESATRTIADLASMSRVTIDLVPRESVVASGPVPETSAFGWIRMLSPFRAYVQDHGKRLSLPVPAGMVLLDLKKRFVAEGPDGARVRAARLENAPQGGSGFWLDAIRQRLAPEFAKAETSDVGAWKVLRLVDRSEKPYVFVLAVRADGRHLDLVEVYYPSEAQETRYADAVKAMLAGGAS
jgi:hypothetical protein